MPEHDRLVAKPLVQLLPGELPVPQLVITPADEGNCGVPLRIGEVGLHLLLQRLLVGLESLLDVAGPGGDVAQLDARECARWVDEERALVDAWYRSNYGN